MRGGSAPRMQRFLRPSFWILILLAVVPHGLATADCAPRFREAGERWGIAFRHRHGGTGVRYMPETMTGGVALLDFDGDGDLDLLFVDAGPTPGYAGTGQRTVLLRNDGGTFADWTVRAGIALPGYTNGVVAGDFDGDGELDLYVSAFGRDTLLRNRGDGTFEDVTEAAGLGETAWSMSAVFFDADGDGRLDLYVTGYVDFDWERNVFCGDRETGVAGYCHPDKYSPLPDRFYLNLGNGRFVEATSAAGLARAPGNGLGVVASDLDGDGHLDLYVANDLTPNFLFRNRGDGTFEDLSLLSGTAYGPGGRAEAGMGVDAGDFDGDGRFDLVVTNFELETHALYRNLGDLLFTDVRFPAGLGDPTLLALGWGIAFADLDHSGTLDLVVANGHILDNPEALGLDSIYRQRNQLFAGDGAGRLREIRDSGLDLVRASRALVLGDLDGDGDLDLVIVNVDDDAEVYENVAGSACGGWLAVDLAGAGGNRFGVGARLIATVAGRELHREVFTGRSYLAQSELTVRFGLGSADGVDALEVRWPGGRRQRFERLPANRRLHVLERALARPAG
jgi:enediyne biosynthesis protein E4